MRINSSVDSIYIERCEVCSFIIGILRSSRLEACPWFTYQEDYGICRLNFVGHMPSERNVHIASAGAKAASFCGGRLAGVSTRPTSVHVIAHGPIAATILLARYNRFNVRPASQSPSRRSHPVESLHCITASWRSEINSFFFLSFSSLTSPPTPWTTTTITDNHYR